MAEFLSTLAPMTSPSRQTPCPSAAKCVCVRGIKAHPTTRRAEEAF